MKHWKQPDEKSWYSFIVDGKRIGTIEDSPKCQKEIKRLKLLQGVDILPASGNDLIMVNAKTVLPRRITDKMESIYKDKQNRWSS